MSNSKPSARTRLLIALLASWLLPAVFFAGASRAESISFSSSSWKPLVFKKIERHTEYSFSEEMGNWVVCAKSEKSASGLYAEIPADPKKYPMLSWSWKVEKIPENRSEKNKGGDDFAARVYVTFRYDPKKASAAQRFKYGLIRTLYGEYPPEAAVNYVWASSVEKGRSWPNPYAPQAMMVAVESGSEKTGQWVREERNLYEDYKKLFKEEPPEILGIALMTDTDNTGRSASACYRDLRLIGP